MNLKYMDLAFLEADKAFKKGEVPVGVVIVKNDKILAKAFNLKEKTNCVINHAEIIAIKRASKRLKNWRLDDCDMYVTLEPCPMCASAIKQCRIKNVYSAVSNKHKNNNYLIDKIFECDETNPAVCFFNNLDCKRSETLLQKFFSKRRKK